MPYIALAICLGVAFYFIGKSRGYDEGYGDGWDSGDYERLLVEREKNYWHNIALQCSVGDFKEKKKVGRPKKII